MKVEVFAKHLLISFVGVNQELMFMRGNTLGFYVLFGWFSVGSLCVT